MDAREVDTAVHELKLIAGTNQRYHQILAFRWNVADKAIRIAVGALSVFSVALSTFGAGYAGASMAVGWISLAVAVALNLLPTGDYVKDNTDLFRRWSELYRASHMIKTRFDLESSDKASPEVRSRIAEAKEIEQTLHASQVAPFTKLFAQCEAAEIRSVYGVDTLEQAHSKQWPSSSRPVEAVAVAAVAVVGSETAGAVR